MKKQNRIKKIKVKSTLPGKIFFLLFGFFVALILLSYRENILQFFQNKLSTPVTTGIVYHGILPCADCSGLETILTLSPSLENPNVGTYTLKQTYQGKNVAPFTETGVWTTSSKNFSGKTNIVYRFVADKTNTVTYYMQLDGTHVQMLDSEGNSIDTPFNNSLTKQ